MKIQQFGINVARLAAWELGEGARADAAAWRRRPCGGENEVLIHESLFLKMKRFGAETKSSFFFLKIIDFWVHKHRFLSWNHRFFMKIIHVS